MAAYVFPVLVIPCNHIAVSNDELVLVSLYRCAAWLHCCQKLAVIRKDFPFISKKYYEEVSADNHTMKVFSFQAFIAIAYGRKYT